MILTRPNQVNPVLLSATELRMPPLDVFFFEAFREEAPELLSRLPSNVRASSSPATIQESGLKVPPARLISIRTQSVVPADWLPAIAGILARSTGFDHLLPLASSGVRLGALPEYCSRAVAEHAILAILALLRRLPRQIQQFRAFDRDNLTGREAAGSTLALFGVGRIGHDIALAARGLGMSVLGVDIVPRRRDIDYVSPAEALRRADAIACAMNLTRENTGYFTTELLEACERNPVFVNVSRGELAPTPTLEAALVEGRLSGLALDVFDHESALAGALRSDHPTASADLDAIRRLARRDDVILTPHNAFNTRESVARKSEYSIRQVTRFLETGAFEWSLQDLSGRD